MAGYVCPECGLDYDSISPRDASASMRSYPRRYRAQLTSLDDTADIDPDSVVRRRPDPTTWSALEYTAHVADVVDELAGIVRRMTVEDHPTLSMRDPDERAKAEAYNEQEPSAVLDRLAAACDRMASTIDQVSPDDWTRTATFPWGERDAITMTRNAVHEGHHHLRDVERVLTAVRGRTAAADADDDD